MITDQVPVRRPGDLTAEWLSGVLGQDVRGFGADRIGTGQMSENYRVTIDSDDGPPSVVIKVAASDPTSRATGVNLGAYEREIRFYREVAGLVGGDAVVPCYAACFDPTEGWFTLVLEDLSPATQGDQIAGCDVESARIALRALGQLQAPVLGDAELAGAGWVNGDSPLNGALLQHLWPGFLDRYGARVAPEHRELIERFLPAVDPWAEGRPTSEGLVHGDFRLDNLLFGAPDAPRPFAVVDWQTCGWGPAINDAAYFLGGSLPVEDRRAAEEDLMRDYHALLDPSQVSWDECWEGYRYGAFAGVLMAVAASMLVVRTPRGDDMFMTTLARHAQHAIDLDSADLLPADAGPPAPERPDPDDESAHEPGPEELWNESWYFDAVDSSGKLGAYVRVGLLPNLGHALYTAYVVGEGRPCVSVVAQVPLPGPDLQVRDDGLEATHTCVDPLRVFNCTVRGRGQAHDDPAAILRGDDGRPVDVSLDLRWTTAGDPYAYRMTTRYEIPCDVEGTVTIDGEELTIAGPGQRDHSWGVRDWWSMDWVWSAFHLDDGARLHGVQIRLPGHDPIGIGYVQDPDLVELTAVDATEEVGDDGLITSARVELRPTGHVLEAEPVAFGPILLTAPDGRVSDFPRALVRARVGDGRSAVGWMEWNRNRAH